MLYTPIWRRRLKYKEPGCNVTWGCCRISLRNYSAVPVNFLQNHHKRHPIARPLGGVMRCLLWVQTLIYILTQSRQFAISCYIGSHYYGTWLYILNSNATSFIHNIPFSCQIILKFCVIGQLRSKLLANKIMWDLSFRVPEFMIKFILPLMRDHLLFKTMLRSGLFHRVSTPQPSSHP